MSNKKDKIKKKLFHTDEQSEENQITIISEKYADGIFLNILRYILPSYLIRAYETYNIISILKEVNSKLILNKIVNTIVTNVFISEDSIRDECIEDDLEEIERRKYDKTYKKSLSSIDTLIKVNKSNSNDKLQSTPETTDDKNNQIVNLNNIFSKKVLTLIAIKGIPNHNRSQFWMLVSGAKYEYLNNPGLYDFLVKKYPVPLAYEKQIELDIKRTFPEDPFFRDWVNLKKIKNVLLAYSRKNCSIGYVQGFNFIVGKLLKQSLSEEEVFYLFSSILEQKMPCNYYSEMCGLMGDVDITIKLIYIFTPDLYIHLINNDLLEYLKNILLQWYLSIFTHNFSDDLGLFVLDLFFIQGSIILIKIGFLIVKENEEKLLSINSIPELIKILNKSNSRELMGDMAELKLKMMEDFILNDEILNQNRDHLSKFIESRIKEINKYKIDKKKEDFQNVLNKNPDFYCDPDWPVCLYDIVSHYSVCEYFIFRVDYKDFNSLFIDDYFYNTNSRNNELYSTLYLNSKRTNNVNYKLEYDSYYGANANQDQENENLLLRHNDGETNNIANANSEFIDENTSFKQKKGSVAFSFRKQGKESDMSESSDDLNENIQKAANENIIKPFKLDFSAIKEINNTNDSDNKQSTRSKISFKDMNKINKLTEIRYEDVLIERKFHSELCIKKNKQEKIINFAHRKKEDFEFKGFDSLDFNLINSNKNKKEDEESYIELLQKYKGRAMKSVSQIYSPSFLMSDQEEGDFFTFICNIKNKYNKIVETKDMCLSLLEENRKKMGNNKRVSIIY